MSRPLITTGQAARAIGVDRGTLIRWWRRGLVKPVLTLPDGAGRWDLDQLMADLNALRADQGEEDSPDHP